MTTAALLFPVVATIGVYLLTRYGISSYVGRRSPEGDENDRRSGILIRFGIYSAAVGVIAFFGLIQISRDGISTTFIEVAPIASVLLGGGLGLYFWGRSRRD